MIAVIIPVHNEEKALRCCLQSVALAAAHSSLHGEAVATIAVLDRCADRSAEAAHALATLTVVVDAGCVGTARAAGSACAVAIGARWLCHTDADTVVAVDWIAAQLATQADAVCGTVAVADWSHLGALARRRFYARYRDADGHRHVHGANLGVATEAYVRAGGFADVKTAEDVDLVQRLERSGANIAWSAKPRVSTSGRLTGRAPAGFADYLRALAASLPLAAS